MLDYDRLKKDEVKSTNGDKIMKIILKIKIII